MSGTKRTPVARQQVAARVTPRAIQLFDSMRRIRRCDCPPYDPMVDWRKERVRCAYCKRRSDLDDQLHRELGLRPWEWPTIQNPNWSNPFPVEHAHHRQARPPTSAPAQPPPGGGELYRGSAARQNEVDHSRSTHTRGPHIKSSATKAKWQCWLSAKLV